MRRPHFHRASLLAAFVAAAVACSDTHAPSTPIASCASEPIIIGRAAAAERALEAGIRVHERSVLVVSVDGHDVVGWTGPDRYELRVLGRGAEIVAERSWPHDLGSWPGVRAPQLFARPEGLVVVRLDGSDVVSERLDLHLQLTSREVLVADATTFCAIEVGVDEPLVLAPLRPSEASFDGTTLLYTRVLGHGTWEFGALDESGAEIEPAIDQRWSVPSGAQHVRRLAPRAFETGRHAAVVVGAEGESPLVRIAGEEPSTIDSFTGDATITWAHDHYAVVLAGSIPAHRSGVDTGIYLLDVEVDGTLRAPVHESELLAAAAEPTHPSSTGPIPMSDGQSSLGIAFLDGEDVVYRRACRLPTSR